MEYDIIADRGEENESNVRRVGDMIEARLIEAKTRRLLVLRLSPDEVKQMAGCGPMSSTVATFIREQLER